MRKFHSKVTPRRKPVSKKTVGAKIKKGEPFELNFATFKACYGKPSTTVDLWTSKARMGFIAVSLHLQTKHEFQTKVHLPTPHTAGNIQTKYDC